MSRFLIALLFLPLAALAAPFNFPFQPPAGTWQNAGKTGGIPTGRIADTTITSTGDTTNRATAIQNALNSCPSGKDVLLGPGTFRVNSQLSIPAGVCLRGSGMFVTTIDFRGSGGSAIQTSGAGGDANYMWPSTPQTVTSAVTAGTTTLTVSSASSFTVGKMCRVEVANQQNNAAITAGAVPIIHPGGGTYLRTQLGMVVSKTSTTLTISPGLLVDYTGLTVRVKPSSTDTVGHGIQDLTLDCDNGTPTFPIHFASVSESWIYSVEIKHAQSGYGLYWTNVLKSTLKHCYIHGTPFGVPNGAGILFGVNGDGACYNLIEDNQVTQSSPNLEINFSSSGNVFGYNYCYETSHSTPAIASIDTNHGPHNAFNLYEGNVVRNFQSDGYFGSESETTFFRNYCYGTDPFTGDRASMLLQRFFRRGVIVANRYGANTVSPYNELGKPNMGNGSFSGSIQPTAGTFWADWPGSPGGGDAGYQERDLDVAASSVFKGNYWNSGTVISGESLGTDTLPDSLYLSSKPDFMGSLTWPIDPSQAQTHQSNAAGYRYANSQAEPPGGGGETDTTAPTPNPSTISSTSKTDTTITVTATTATDADSPPVLYRFSSDNGSTWSAYQSGATYTFTGLSASTTYQVKVQARDSAATPNATTASSATSVTTDVAAPAAPPVARLRRGALIFP